MSPERWLKRWSLRPDGDAVVTRASHIHPVLSADGRKAMLKIATEAGHADERTAEMLRYYDGEGAVRLLNAEANVALMERAEGRASLRHMALSGEDAAVTRIICSTVQKLHRARGPAPEGLPSLDDLFTALFDAADHPALAACAVSARRLLSDPTRIPLHGDIHHENILDSRRGWLAIDPKGRLGPPVYDFANLFLNPINEPALVQNPGRMRRLAGWVAAGTGHAPGDILAAAHAHAGLATLWSGIDGQGAAFGLRCAALLHALGGEFA